MPLDQKIPYQDLTHKIIGAGMKVHGRLSPGLKEEHSIKIHANNAWLGRLYLDLLVEDCVIIETKASPPFIDQRRSRSGNLLSGSYRLQSSSVI